MDKKTITQVKTIISPAEAAEKVIAAKERTEKKTTNEPVQPAFIAKANYKEPKVKLTKQEKKIKKAKDAVEKAEQNLKDMKQNLEEAKRLNKEKDIKKYEKEVKKKQADLKKAKEKLRKAKGDESMDLGKVAKRAKKNEEERKKAGMDDKKKDERTKGKGKDNQNNNAKLASHINLPSGMRIRQDGPDYVLVTTDKAGNEHTTPVTDVINQIDKYNKGVDAQNAATKAQGAVKPQLQNDSIPTSRNPGNVPEKEVSTPTIARTPTPTPAPTAAPTLPTVSDNELKGAENIAAASGKVKPEDVQEFAKAATQLSKLGILKDPHAIEELNKRRKKQEEKEREEEEARRRRQQSMSR